MPYIRHVARYLTLCFVWGWFVSSGGAYAAPLNLSNVPLSLTVKAPPNILFVLDDSASMDWEVMTQDPANMGRFTGTQPDGTSPPGTGHVKHRDRNDDGVADCAFGAGEQTFFGYIYGVEFPTQLFPAPPGSPACNVADDEEWRFRTASFNRLYFDPRREYTPWVGLDSTGRPFGPIGVRAARAHPEDPHSPTIDLTAHNATLLEPLGGRATSDRDRDGRPDGFRYYTWQDRNGNGLFDDGEHTAHKIRDANAATQQNFANWFSYYRKRAYVAKAIIGDLITRLGAVRTGLVTLQQHSNVHTPIRPASDEHKAAVLRALYQSRSGGETPLRTTLRDVGRYLACDPARTLFPGECPALSEAEGGACQGNFVVLMTDGLYTDSQAEVGIGNADGDSSSAFDGGAYADSVPGTLADMAMHFYEKDLQPTLANNVPPSGVDEATHQHMVTFTIAFGLQGTLASDPPDRQRPFPWPDPRPHDLAGNLAKIDDLRHAAFNGRGVFATASDPDELRQRLGAALQRVTDSEGAVATVSVNSGTLNADGRAYQAGFNSSDWRGWVRSFRLSPEGLPARLEWDAAVELDQVPSAARRILTSKPSTGRGIPLLWDELDQEQQAALSVNAAGGQDRRGMERLNYLRGSPAQEGVGSNKGFRTRKRVSPGSVGSPLGDIINSVPFWVGLPALPGTLGPGYAAFRDTLQARGRAPMLLVGSNDGLFHVFHGTNGQELLAYMPQAILPRVRDLALPTYNAQHRYYVDGSPTAGDVWMRPRCGSSPAWRTVAVSGLRAGGQGYFALDITEPEQFATVDPQCLVLWEFTAAHDQDLGFTFSQPSLVKLRTSSRDRWATVFGNGYNNTGSGHAVLFIVFLDGGVDGVWTPGVDYIKIDTGDLTGVVDTPAGRATRDSPNGLATPAVIDLNDDFYADFIVAGDLHGHLWKFDVRSLNPADWRVAYVDAERRPVPMFIATDATGKRQPITSLPEVGFHPDEDPNDPHTFMVYVGTGKYLEPTDNRPVNTPGAQTFYGVWDEVPDNENPPGAPRQRVPTRRQQLLAQEVEAEMAVNGQTVRVTTDRPIAWQGPERRLGWRLDLPTPGERQVSDALLRHDRILFTTLIPHPEPCSPGGAGFVMELQAGSGGRLPFTTFDLNADRKLDSRDRIRRGDGAAEGVAASGLVSTVGIPGTPAVLYDPATGHEVILLSGAGGGGLLGRSTQAIVTGAGDHARGRQSWQHIQP